MSLDRRLLINQVTRNDIHHIDQPLSHFCSVLLMEGFEQRVGNDVIHLMNYVNTEHGTMVKHL